MIRDTSLRELQVELSRMQDALNKERRKRKAIKSFKLVPYWWEPPLENSAYNDLIVSPGLMKQPASSAPTAAAWLTNLQKWHYTDGDYSFFDGWQLPHSYVPETDLKPHVHFAPTTALSDGETVVWTITYSGASVGRTFPATADVTCTFTNNPATRLSMDSSSLSGSDIVANTHLIAGGATMSGVGLGLSAVIDGKLLRSAAGTYPDAVVLLSVDAHIRINRLGSQQEYTG